MGLLVLILVLIVYVDHVVLLEQHEGGLEGAVDAVVNSYILFLL